MAPLHYHCPNCYTSLSGNETGLHCPICNSVFPKTEDIYDLFYDPSALPKEEEYSVDFNREVLYNTSEDLETRVRYFNKRFRHNLSCDQLFEYVNSLSPQVLEIGCGTMNALLPVGANYNQHQQVSGVDISLPLLLRAKVNKPYTQLCMANAAALPFSDQSFDLIWSRHMLYHVEDAKTVLKDSLRCLKKEGIFCLSTNSASNKPEMHAFHEVLLLKNNIQGPASVAGSTRFPAETADKQVSPYFRYTLKINYYGYFHFANSEEFLDYYTSTAYFKKLIKEGYDKQALLESARVLLQENPILKLSNNGAVVVATNSLKLFNQLSTFTGLTKEQATT